MKRVLSALCVVAMLLGMLPMTVLAAGAETGKTSFNTLQDAVDSNVSETIVLTEDTANLVVSKDVTIDLNGHSIAGVTVKSGVTLQVMDSETDDYTVADGIYGKLTNISGSVEAADGYVKLAEGAEVSFHRVDLELSGMTLRPGRVGVYYSSDFSGDEVVAAAVESYGVALNILGEPNASNMNTTSQYSVLRDFAAGKAANAANGTLLHSIMLPGNSDAQNAQNAETAIYGRAYIKTADGYIFGNAASRDLKTLVEAIDGMWSKLSDNQQAAALDMYKLYKNVMGAWSIPHIILFGNMPEIDIPVNSANGVVTEEVTVEQDGVIITVPFGALLEEGVEELTLTVGKKASSDSGVEVSEDEELVPMDVHVEGLSPENTAPLTIYLGKVMPENLNMGNYRIYHVEADGTHEMELVANDEEFTKHNQYKYTLDGELTLHMASFSEVAVVSDTENAWQGKIADGFAGGTGSEADPYTIRNADQLAYFSQVVSRENETYGDKYYKLLADIDLNGAEAQSTDDKKFVFYPVGYWAPGEGANAAGEETWYTYGGSFRGVFDGNGNTIGNIYQNTWLMDGNYESGYWDDAMGIFGYINGGTVKNLTVDNFQSDGEFTPTGCVAAYAVNSTFENIALTNCNPRVYNTGNGGIVGIGGNSSDPDDYKLTFNNITIDNSNKITALWGSWDVACGGLIGMFRGAGHVYMNNCHVAAQIDVYNDVCGNYQYYWYRYSGMLIGTNKNMITDKDGYTVPETEKFHATGCTVHFGDWNDYYYCELVANSLASYTHDHQFSRLTEIKSIEGTTITYLDGTTGTVPASGRANYVVVNGNEGTENAICYHFVDGAVWNHEDAGTEVINSVEVLKENNQHIYLPFNQLFTGYGWGVKHIPIYDDGTQNVFAGVTILPRVTANSVEKFEKAENAEDAYASGTEITIGELFQAADQDEVKIISENIQISVSPADETSTAGGIYVANAEDWTQGKLTFTGIGKAKVTITDYYYCTPTTVEVEILPVAAIGEIEYASLQDALDAVEDGGTVTLLTDLEVKNYLDVYTADGGSIERDITLDLGDNTIAPAEGYKYQYYPMVFVGVNQTITIKNGKIAAAEHVAVGAYGHLNLENVTVTSAKLDEGETAVCIWNWSEDDDYYQDYQYKVTGSATITGGSITGGILVEGPVTLSADADFDKLYLNNTTGRGKLILPKGYGLVKENDYYINLHAHTYNAEHICTVEGCGAVEVTYTYVEKALTEIKSTDIVVITMTTADGTVYALTNGNGAADAPIATVVRVANDALLEEITDNLRWSIVNNDGALTIYPNGVTGEWLYCTNANNGVRVGTGVAKTFVIDADTGYLKTTETEEMRYIGVYTTNPDWRCYTNTTGNITNQSLKFYVAVVANCEHKNTEDRIAITATCTEAGHEAGTYCIDCETYTVGGALINATGHSWSEWKTVKEATCTVDGQKAANCTVCNKRTTQTIKAAHTAGEVVIENKVDATCTTDGSYDNVVYCTVDTCKAEISRETITITAPGHNYVDGKCTACGAEEPDQGGETTVSVTVADYADANGWTDSKQYTTLNVDSEITAAVTGGGNTGKYYTNGENWRLYQTESATLTISAAEGKTIKTVKITYSSDKNGVLTYNSVSVASDKAVDVNATSITFSVGNTGSVTNGQVRITAIEVVYVVGETPECQHTNTEDVAAVAATCTETGYTAGVYCNDCETYISGHEEIAVLGHNYSGEVTTAAGCETTGVMTYTCANCGDTYTEEIAATGHTYVDGTCSVCGAEDPNAGGYTEPTVLATFDFGANGSASHVDGNDLGTTRTYTADSYTLNLTSMSKVFGPAYDAKGNSCIKLGTSSVVGSFSFTVADDVTKVVIYIAKYKDNTSKITVNGTNYTLTKNSDDGAYDEIVIDTTTNKTVTLATASGGVRAMVDAIVFKG